MHERVIQTYQARADTSLPTQFFNRFRQKAKVAQTAVSERVRPPEAVVKESVVAAFVLPSERHLLGEVKGNRAAIAEAAEWVGISHSNKIFDEVNKHYDGFERNLSGRSRSDSTGGYKTIKLNGGREAVLDIMRAHDARNYPFTVANPQERGKYLSFMGMDLVVATMFETRDGLGSRFSKVFAQPPGEDYMFELQLTDENGYPFPVTRVFEQVAIEDGYSLPVGLTLYGIREDDSMAYAARVLTLPKDPHDPKPDPRLVILSPKEDGEYVDKLALVVNNNQRIDVKVKDVHMPIARNFFVPAEAIRVNNIDIPATHIVERNNVGGIVRVDGVKRTLNSLPEFPGSYVYILDPVEGEVDEDTRKERNRLARVGKNDEDRIGQIVGVDIIVTGTTAGDLSLADDPKPIVSGQLAAVRSIPLEDLPLVV